MIASGWAYIAGVVPWWVCVPVSAIFASFIHELEHDLIHTLYFRKHPRAYHLMMALCWITRPSTVSPWTRRRLHQIGRASRRERGCTYVSISVVAASLKNKNKKDNT